MIKYVVLVAIVTGTIATPLKSLSSKTATNSGRIVGGHDTTIENVPYQVSFQLFDKAYCGGSIISDEWIITAGHCADNSPDAYTIRAGSTNVNKGGSVHNVSRIIQHENYGFSDGLPKNDIALIQVVQPFEFDSTRQSIPLFDRYEDSTPGSDAVITGWGNTLQGFPDTLQLVKVPIISKRQCHISYLEVGGLPENQICAAYPEGGKDACQGDSGGPLAINGRLAGITSWGIGCARPSYPGVYTEIAAHRSWIKRNINI